MSDAFIIRRGVDGGGGGGLSKCSIIVHIDSGSTVAAYSNSSATTLVKTGEEIGTSGDYLITGLNTGTYYVKATKGTESTISSAVSFSAYGVKDIVLSYQIILFENGTLSTLLGSPKIISSSGGDTLTTFAVDSQSQKLKFDATAGASTKNIAYVGFTKAVNFSGKSNLKITLTRNTQGVSYVGLNSNNAGSLGTKTTLTPNTTATYTIPLGSYQGNYYIVFNSETGAGGWDVVQTYISKMWIV